MMIFSCKLRFTVIGLLALAYNTYATETNCTTQLLKQSFINQLSPISPESTQKEALEMVASAAARTRSEILKNKIPIDKYLAAIDKISSRDPVFKKISKMFDHREYTFAVDKGESNRLNILKNGFLNQYQTNTSSGALAHESRNFVESLYLRQKPDEYSKISNTLKPKSMYLMPEVNSGIDFRPTHYAEDFNAKPIGDTWVLDLKKIESNTLFVNGDSLDRALLDGDLLDDQKAFTLNLKKRFNGTQIIHHLLPLDWLKMSIPFYYEQVAQKNILRFVDPEIFRAYYKAEVLAEGGFPMWREAVENTSQPNFNQKFFTSFPELKPFLKKILVRPYGNYTEGLFFGELTPNKIKKLIYRTTPPNPLELNELKKLGIEVEDGRKH